jgi:hypothetical protein
VYTEVSTFFVFFVGWLVASGTPVSGCEKEKEIKSIRLQSYHYIVLNVEYNTFYRICFKNVS